MKGKILALSALLVSASVSMNAQDNYYTKKWTDNIFVSVGGGIHSINNDGFNKKVKVFKLFNKMMGTRIGRVFTVIGMVLIMALFFGLLIGVIGIFMTYVLPVLAIIILLKIIVAAIRGK